jgi:ATP-dependent Clp protease ATP-binding subunit ClpB
LRGLKEKYELFHGVHITDDALGGCGAALGRYIPDRFLPDKAIDLIDEASSSLRISLENKPPALEDAHRKIMRLEVEKEALRKEAAEEGGQKAAPPRRASKQSSARSPSLKKRPASLSSAGRTKSRSSSDIKSIKKELESLRMEADAAEARSTSRARQRSATARYQA